MTRTARTKKVSRKLTCCIEPEKLKTAVPTMECDQTNCEMNNTRFRPDTLAFNLFKRYEKSNCILINKQTFIKLATEIKQEVKDDLRYKQTTIEDLLKIYRFKTI